MKKLTLVSIMCRYKSISAFLNLPVYNGKVVLHQSTINKLFKKYHGFIPERGETISIG